MLLQDQRKLIDFGASGPDSAPECEVHENIYASLAEVGIPCMPQTVIVIVLILAGAAMFLVL